jgi:hypothetical protein
MRDMLVETNKEVRELQKLVESMKDEGTRVQGDIGGKGA